jgi:hypothetical protein
MEYIAFDAHKRYTLASVVRPDGRLGSCLTLPRARSGRQTTLTARDGKALDILEIQQFTKMLRLLKRVVRWAVALVLIVSGLLLSVPGIPGPGLLIALIGVFVLMPESRWLRKKYVALEHRYPRLFRRVKALRLRCRRAHRTK